MEKGKPLPINNRSHTFVQTTTINNSQLAVTKILINFPNVPQIKPHSSIILTKIEVIYGKLDSYKIKTFYILEEAIKQFIASIKAIKEGANQDYQIGSFYTVNKNHYQNSKIKILCPEKWFKTYFSTLNI